MTRYSKIQECASRHASRIKKPMDIHAIVDAINGGEYSAELMLQHLLQWAAKTERALQDPHCVRAMTLRGEIVAYSPSCQWTEDEDGNWSTACGECFVFETGGPKENKAQWCPFCGGKLETKPCKP
jgi:hypothetical protein